MQTLLAISAILILLCVNHTGFIVYSANLHVLANIDWKQFLHNILITPLLFVPFLTASWASGRKLLALLAEDQFSEEYKDIFSLALGMGLLNLIIFMLAVLKIVTPVSIIILLAIANLFALNDIKRFYTNKHFSFQFSSTNIYNKILVLLLIIALAYSYINALSYPISWDVLAYHLPIAKFYAMQKGIYRIDWLINKQCMAGMEMLPVACLALKNDVLPQLFSFTGQLILLSGMYIFTSKHFSKTTALLSITILASLPLSLTIGGTLNNDFYVSAYTFFAFISLLEYKVTRNTGWLNVLAAFCGMTINAKMTGLISISFIIFLLVTLHLTDSWKIAIKDIARFILILFIFGSSNYIRNFIFTGDPVFPLFFKYIGNGNNILSYPSQHYGQVTADSQAGIQTSFLNFLLMPYYFITKPDIFQHQPQYFFIPATLILLYRIGTRKRYSMLETVAALFIVYFALIWFVHGANGDRVWRILMPAIPFMVILAAYWWEQIESIRVKAVFGLILAISFIPLLKWNVNNNLFGIFSLPSINQPLTVPKDNYLEKSLDHYKVYKYVNDNLSNNAKVLLFREIRGYYLNKPYIWGDPVNQGVIRYDEFSTPDELKKYLISIGVTHIIINNNIYQMSKYYYDYHTMQLMNDMIKACTLEIYKSKGVILYKMI